MDDLFFIVSKMAWVLLSPSNVFVLLEVLVLVLFWFNKTSFAKLLLTSVVIFGLTVFAYPVSDWLMYPLEKRFSKPIKLPQAVDGIIILGGGESLKVSVSWNTAELGDGADRYIGAAFLARRYPNVPVIFSGGSGYLNFQNSNKESSIAEFVLTAVGIDASRLIIESESRNTYENFVLLKAKLPRREGKYLLVTSAFHMPRAVGIARQQNINVIAYPVDYRSNRSELRQFDFDFFAHMSVLEPAWREWIGLTVYYITGKTMQWLPEQNGAYISPNPMLNVNYPN